MTTKKRKKRRKIIYFLVRKSGKGTRKGERKIRKENSRI